ncbi:septum formation initiator family protein [Streptomyces sp. NPDC088557]|uniref:FtsB family cell division protein n=1 Tax=Streptomyces sp. NPDC088557 TaxID=3365867 RepID=UPI0038303B16
MSTAKGPHKGRAARLGRLMPSGPSSAARTPFVLLVVVLLGGGLISLLVLNSALNQGSFRLNELKNRTTELTDEEQALQRDVDDYAAPDALERRARELGMVPGGSPAFLGPDGKVLGEPSAALAPKPSTTPTPAPTAPSAPVRTTAPAAPPPAATGSGTGSGTGSSTGSGTAKPPTSPGTTGTDTGTTAPKTTAPDPTTSGR